MANQDDDRDDDDQKDADESDDEGSAGRDEGDDEGSEDEDEGEEDAPAAAAPSDSVDDASDEDEEEDAPAAAAPPPSAPASTTKSKAKPTSAGARVAAAKAAKAAKKAVKKAALAEERAVQQQTSQPGPTSEEEAEDAVEQIKESAVGQAAIHAQDWAKQNEGLVYGVLGLAAIALIGWFGYNYVTDSSAVAAGALLEEAVRISRAEIREEEDGEDADTSSDDEDEAPTFPTVEARNTAALEAYRRVISEHGSSEAAGWAQLGEARLLLASGEPAEARAAFQAAVSAHGADPVIAMRGYEGVGFSYEDEENWDEAREAFERIRSLEDGDYAAVADYHLARIRLATGDEVGAQTALEELVDSIRESASSSEPEFPYVLAQAQTLLRELDPSSADGAEAPMLGAGAGGASEEEIMEMIRRAMEGRGAGGAPPGGE